MGKGRVVFLWLFVGFWGEVRKGSLRVKWGLLLECVWRICCRNVFLRLEYIDFVSFRKNKRGEKIVKLVKIWDKR